MSEGDGYLKEAEELLGFATKELEVAKSGNDETRGRQVCEKAYLAMLKMSNALFLKKGLKIEELPQTDRGRYYFINKFASRQFRESFYKLRQKLHITGFHEGLVDFLLIEEDLQELQNMLHEIK